MTSSDSPSLLSTIADITVAWQCYKQTLHPTWLLESYISFCVRQHMINMNLWSWTEIQ